MPQEGRKVCKVAEGGLYVAPNGMCKISTFDKEEKSRVQSFEEALREEQIIERDESIKWVMEEASFNDTIGEMEKVVDLSPHNQQTIQINSIDMYVAIDEYNRSIMVEIVKVKTKYKTMDKKVKSVDIPLPEDSWQKMKEVAQDPSLRDPRGIRYTFTKETREKSRKMNFFCQKKKLHFGKCSKDMGKHSHSIQTKSDAQIQG